MNSVLYNYIKDRKILFNTAYFLIRKYWKVKAGFINYDYPKHNQHTLSKQDIIDYNKNRIFGPQKRFCYAPYNNMHFKTNGDITLCSFNAKLKIGNITQNTLADIWNSKEADYFRNKMTDYDLSHCLECKLFFNFKNYSSLPTTKYDLHATDDISFPTQMSFEISNLCNLECVMCNEDLSSAISKRKNIPLKKSVYTDQFLEQLSPFLSHLKIATFIGGEPLLIKLYFKIWHSILEKNKTCIIHVQTNATLLNNEFLKLLESKKFEIGVSIDAVSKDKFETIRKGANHSEVFKNIEILHRYYIERKINMNINFCLMINNWQELPLMLDFCNDRNLSLKIIHINSPIYLDIKYYPFSTIKRIAEQLQNYSYKGENVIQQRNVKTYEDALANINSYLKFSEELYSFFEQHSHCELDELFNLIIIQIERFVKINNLLKENASVLADFIKNYIINFQAELSIKKDICLHILYHYSHFEHDADKENPDFDLYRNILNDYTTLVMNVKQDIYDAN